MGVLPISSLQAVKIMTSVGSNSVKCEAAMLEDFTECSGPVSKVLAMSPPQLERLTPLHAAAVVAFLC